MSAIVPTSERCRKDAEELREIAEWFDERGGSLSSLNGDFLRAVASRYEVLAGAVKQDEEMCDGWSGDAFAVSVEFARELEKQLAAAQEKIVAQQLVIRDYWDDHRCDADSLCACAICCKALNYENALLAHDAARDKEIERMRAVVEIARKHMRGYAFWDDLRIAVREYERGGSGIGITSKGNT